MKEIWNEIEITTNFQKNQLIAQKNRQIIASFQSNFSLTVQDYDSFKHNICINVLNIQYIKNYERNKKY